MEQQYGNYCNTSQTIYIRTVYAGPEIRTDDNEAFVSLNILSLPDLAISANSIMLSPAAPKDGDMVSVFVTVQNTGEQPASGVAVSITEDGVVIDTKSIDQVPAHSQATIVLAYTTAGKTGPHTITAMVDPYRMIPEQNKDNNSASKTFGVQDSSLWVTEQYISPNGDGVKDGTQFFFGLNEPQTVKILVVNSRNETSRTFTSTEYQNTQAGSATSIRRMASATCVASGSLLQNSSNIENTIQNLYPAY